VLQHISRGTWWACGKVLIERVLNLIPSQIWSRIFCSQIGSFSSTEGKSLRMQRIPTWGSESMFKCRLPLPPIILIITLPLGITELSVPTPQKYILCPCLSGKRPERSTQQYVEALNKETNSTFPNNSWIHWQHIMPSFQNKFNSKGYGLLSCNAMQFRESLTFWRNIWSQSSGSKSKLSKKKAQLSAFFYRFLAWFILQPWRRWWYVSLKYQALHEQHGVRMQKATLFIVITVRISNPTCLILFCSFRGY
jgi:hypothetical protein